jgi:hypothetical protein
VRRRVMDVDPAATIIPESACMPVPWKIPPLRNGGTRPNNTTLSLRHTYQVIRVHPSEPAARSLVGSM